MKQFSRLFLIIAVLGFASGAAAQTDNNANETVTAKVKTPAEKVQKFWFVMIKTGPKQDLDSATKAKLFAGHMANINRLYYDGVLKVAGPFGKNEFAWRGIFIFDCENREDVDKYVAMDPAISAGLFAVDIVPWFGEPIGSFKPGKPEKEN